MLKKTKNDATDPPSTSLMLVSPGPTAGMIYLQCWFSKPPIVKPTAGSIHHHTIDIIHHRNHSIPYHGQTIPSPAGRALPYRHSDFQGNYHFPFLTQAVCSSGKVPRKQRLGKFVMPNEIVCLWLFFFFFGSFKLLPDGTNVAIASINMIVCVSFY